LKIQRLQLKRRFEAFGLSAVVSGQLSDQIMVWYTNSGPEWTAQRLKMIKDYCFSYLYSLPRPELEYIAKDETGRLKGPFRNLCKCSTELTPKQETNLLNCLRSYTILQSDSVTETQYEKFRKSVTDPPPSNVIPETFWSKAHLGWLKDINVNLFYSILGESTTIEDFNYSENRFKPTFPLGKSKPENQEILEEVFFLWNSGPIRELLSSPREWGIETMIVGKPKIVSPKGVHTYLKSLSRYRMSSRFTETGNIDVDWVGKISFLQEPGIKLRAVANPARAYQVALQPLGNFLFRILRELPWDCTFQQDRGLSVIQNHLTNGGTAYCVDLSDATNQFPLDLQEHLIKEMRCRAAEDKSVKRQGINFYEGHLPYLEELDIQMDIFHKISRSKWLCEHEPTKRIAWKKGQPLGLYPSFPMFALCHGAILYELSVQQSLWDAASPCFYILGDDVIILNEQLHQAYRELMQLLGCPISEHKSIVSDTVAEFAGKIITKSKIHPLFKWRMISQDNFVDLLANFGQKLLDLFPRNIKDIALEVCKVPDVCGGLGFNPEGRPFLERLEPYIDLLTQERVVPLRDTRGVTEQQVIDFFGLYDTDALPRLQRDFYYASAIPGSLSTPVDEILSSIDDELYIPYKRFVRAQITLMMAGLSSPKAFSNALRMFVKGAYALPPEHDSLHTLLEEWYGLTCTTKKKTSLLDKWRRALGK